MVKVLKQQKSQACHLLIKEVTKSQILKATGPIDLHHRLIEMSAKCQAAKTCRQG